MKILTKFVVLTVLTMSLILTACGSAPDATNGAPKGPLQGGSTLTPTQLADATVSPTQDTQPSAPASNSAPETEDLTREDAQGAVSVAVTPVNLDQADGTLDFEIQMNTHSVDLNMDLAGLATLTTDTGKTVQPSKWEAPMGGHHVSGTLSFPASSDGTSLLDGATTLTLTIQGVDAPERTFTWSLSSK